MPYGERRTSRLRSGGPSGRTVSTTGGKGEPISGKPTGCGPILIVDDDDGMRALLAELLHESGHATVQASCGKEALVVARAEAPSLVILDVALPSLSGYEVCRALRERFGAEMPILFLSGERTETHDRVAGLLLGGDIS